MVFHRHRGEFFLLCDSYPVIYILFNHGKIKDEKTYGRFTSIGGTDIQNLKCIETSMDEFEYLRGAAGFGRQV